jgi:hypothetical protein
MDGMIAIDLNDTINYITIWGSAINVLFTEAMQFSPCRWTFNCNLREAHT